MKLAHLITIIGSLVLPAAPLPAKQPSPGYVAHEWGTFTSVQGEDGVQMDWLPLTTSELPKFVYDRTKDRDYLLATALTKSSMVARQRLETPVIYFYSPRPREIGAQVNFPQGMVTEWYPRQDGPMVAKSAADPAAHWDHIQILAPGINAPDLPQDSSGSHYYAARKTEANRIQVAARAKGTPETEKFIFYRGIGRFSAPLMVAPLDTDQTSLQLENTGQEPLAALVAYEVRAGAARYEWLPRIEPGKKSHFTFSEKTAQRPLAEVRASLASELQAALIKDGLYAQEASAMVATWDDSWFAEPGVRVLYLLPRPWTDRTLPLTLNPAPDSMVRVMVGRAELLTPSLERQLRGLVERFQTEPPAQHEATIRQARDLGLGRFAEPAMRRISAAQSDNTEFRNAAQKLLTEAWAPKRPAAAPLAAK